MARRGSVGDSAALRAFADIEGERPQQQQEAPRKRRNFQYDVIDKLGCERAALRPVAKEVVVVRSVSEALRMEEAAAALGGALAALAAQGYSRRDLTLHEWRKRHAQFGEALRSMPCVVLNACEKAPRAYYEWLRDLRRHGCLVMQVAGNAVRTMRDQVDEVKDEAAAAREIGLDSVGSPQAQTPGGRGRAVSFSAAALSLTRIGTAELNQAAGGADFHLVDAKALPSPDSLPDKVVAPYATGLAEHAPVREDGMVEVSVYIAATKAHAAERAVLHSKVLPRLAERLAAHHIRLVVIDPTMTHRGATDATVLQAVADCAAHVMIVLADGVCATEGTGFKNLRNQAFEPVLGATAASVELEWVDALEQSLSRQEYECMQATRAHSDVPKARYLDGCHMGGTHILAYRLAPKSLADVPRQHRAFFSAADEPSQRRQAALLSTLYACPFVQVRSYEATFGGVGARARGDTPYLSGLDALERMVEHDIFARLRHELFSHGQLDAILSWHRPEDAIEWRLRHSLDVYMTRGEAEKMLMRAVKLGRPSLIAVGAKVGMGITQTLVRVLRETRRTYGGDLGLAVFWGGSSGRGVSTVAALRSVCRQVIVSCAPHLDDVVLPQDADGLMHALVAMLAEGSARAKKRLLVVFDAVDTLVGADRPWLPKEADIPENCQVMFSFSEAPKRSNKMGTLLGSVGAAALLVGTINKPTAGGEGADGNGGGGASSMRSKFRMAAARTMLTNAVDSTRAEVAVDPLKATHYCMGGQEAQAVLRRRVALGDFLPRWMPGPMNQVLKVRPMGVNERKNLHLKLARAAYKEPTELLMGGVLSKPAAISPLYLQLMHVYLLRAALYDAGMLAAAAAGSAGRGRASRQSAGRQFQARVDSLPSTVDEAAIAVLGGLEAEFGRALVQATFSALVCAGGGGLTLEHLVRVAGAAAVAQKPGVAREDVLNSLPPLSSPVWHELLSQTRSLVARTHAADGLYSIAHDELVLVASQRYVLSADIDSAICLEIADILEATLHHEVLEGAPEAVLDRVGGTVSCELGALGAFDAALLLCPRMLLRAGQVGRAVALVTSTKFLEAKIRYGMLHELKRDLEALLDISNKPDMISDASAEGMTSMDVIGIRQLLLLLHCRGKHIAQSPHLLLQEMLNTTTDLVLPEAAYIESRDGGHARAGQQYRVPARQDASDRVARAKLNVIEGEVMLQRVNPRGESEVCLHHMHSHSDRVLCCAFSPIGDVLASGSADKSVRLWEAHSGKEVFRFEGHAHHVRALAWSHGGATLASGSVDGAIALWNVARRDRILLISAHDDHVRCLYFSPTNTFLLSGSNDCSITIWEIPNSSTLGETTGMGQGANARQRALMTLEGHMAAVTAVCYVARGTRVCSASLDGSVRVWNPITRQAMFVLREFAHWVTCLVAAADDATIYAGSLDGTVVAWSAVTGRPVRRIRLPNLEPVLSMAIGPGGMEGEQLCVGTRGGSVGRGGEGAALVWRAGTWVARFDGHASDVCDVSLSPVAPLAASVGADRDVRIWGCTTQLASETVGRAFLPSDGSADDTEIGCLEDIVEGDGESERDTSSVRSGSGGAGPSALPQTTHAAAHADRINALAFVSSPTVPDAVLLVSAGDDGDARVYEVGGEGDPHFALRSVFGGHDAAVLGLARERAGDSLIFSAGRDGTILQWDALHGAERMMLVAHEGRVPALAVDGGSQLLASADSLGALSLWTMSGGSMATEPSTVAEAHPDAVACLAFSTPETGNRLASGAADGTVRLWAVTPQGDARLSDDLSPHARGVRCCCWGHIGAAASEVLVTGAADGGLWVWDARASTRPVSAIGGGYHGEGDPINGAAFVQDAREDCLATIAGDKLSLWDLRQSAARCGLHTVASAPVATALAAGPGGLLAVADGRTVSVLRACSGLELWNLT